jgi:hypothetical protein
LSGGRPGDYVEDPETAIVLDALYEAAPEVLTQMVRRAARRTRPKGSVVSEIMLF